MLVFGKKRGWSPVLTMSQSQVPIPLLAMTSTLIIFVVLLVEGTYPLAQYRTGVMKKVSQSMSSCHQVVGMLIFTSSISPDQQRHLRPPQLQPLHQPHCLFQLV